MWQKTPLGNLLADVIRAYAATDLALLRCATVRHELSAGPIRRTDLARINWNGDDHLVRLQLTGREIRVVLESGAREPYRLLLTAGARVEYDAAQPLGRRVVAVHIADHGPDPDHTYTVACSEVLANGIGDYLVLSTKPREMLPHTIADVLAAHIQAVGTIHPTCDRRLVVHGTL